MSRLPTLSTPGRTPSGPSTGIPTPTARRPRSSLGPTPTIPSFSTPDAEMDQALRDVLRTRPPSSLRHKAQEEDDPDTPPQGSSNYLVPGPGKGLAAPRTPGPSAAMGLRPRTPSALGLGQPSAPITPSSSRASSRPSLSGRPSLGGGGLPSYTPRRTSMASTTSTTPYGRRPESRASVTTDHGSGGRWAPIVGERVRMQSLGMEGTLRFVGETQFKEGVWAGVELEGGFAGKGRNDGTVDDVSYFTCPPLCGIFILASKLSPPTSGPSRPASVASSHRSLASSQASIHLHGRSTPSGRATPSASRPSTSTPARARVVTRRIADNDNGDKPQKTLLGTSTSTNAGIESKITAGSRASKYIGMTAKQLESAKSGGLHASVRNLGVSTSTTTPKASRVSMGMAGVTPARSARQSLGNSLVTPRAKGPRASTATDMMPPPPSPGNITRVVQAHQAQLEEEIRDLKARNAQLEEQLQIEQHQARGNADGEKEEAEKLREEADSLRHQLSASQADAADANKLAEELQAAHATSAEELSNKESALKDLQKEMRLAAERAQGELEAAMEAKGAELREMRERADKAEVENQSFSRLVEELSEAGQATIALYESEKFKLDDRIRVMEEKLLKVKEERDQAQEALANAATSSSDRTREAVTAAEIDNETLNAQVKHLQNKINHLEEEIEEVRAQAELDADTWQAKVQKAKDGEKKVGEQVVLLKGEISELKIQAGGAKGRIGELEGALKENQAALEVARAEIETLRVEASEAASMRSALQAASANEKLLASKEAEVAQLKGELVTAGELKDKTAALEAQVATLQTEITTLKSDAAAAAAVATTATEVDRNQQDKKDLEHTPRKARLSTPSTDDADKKLRGFQHIIQDLSAENAELKERIQLLTEETGLLKEEIKLLEETSEGGGADVAELREARSAIDNHLQTIKELNREVSELESLIESKIYREDELETRANELEHELDHLRRQHTKLQQQHERQQSANTVNGDGYGHSRQSSVTSSISHLSQHSTENGDGEGEGRCELCEGPHDLDACPVFAGNTLGGPELDEGKKLSGGGRFCADCESIEHDTADCPLAEDVF